MFKNKLNKTLYLFLFLYLSLVIGFIIDENLNYGSYNDWRGTNLPVIEYLAFDFKNTILNYDDLGHRHSPVYLIVLSLLFKLGVEADFIRLINLHLSLFLIYFFYKCLRLRFPKEDKNVFIILSYVFFLSPTFRSLAIWPDSRLFGLLFFLISIYNFLKFSNNNDLKYFWNCLTFLILSSYISPNFSFFILFYYFVFFKKVSKFHILYSFLFCFLSSLPAIYYLFVLDVNFLINNTPSAAIGATAIDFNLSNKILIIGTIILFHLTPFLVDKKIIKNTFVLNSKQYVLISIFFIINLLFFNYSANNTGGGFFFQISQIIFKNNILFYIIAGLSFLIIFKFLENNYSSLLFIFLLVFSNIQTTIYHKYYDPLLLIVFFTIFDRKFSENFLKKKYSIQIVYIFYIGYIGLRLVKNNFIV